MSKEAKKLVKAIKYQKTWSFTKGKKPGKMIPSKLPKSKLNASFKSIKLARAGAGAPVVRLIKRARLA